MRALDYLLTRSEVDRTRISITGTSGGGFQAAIIAALDRRIQTAAPSCYITALPMRVANRIFMDPDSDPEQDPAGMIADGIGHAGLLVLMYPRPVFVAAAVLDFFPIEGTRATFREVARVYRRFGHGRGAALAVGVDGRLLAEDRGANQVIHCRHMPGLTRMSSISVGRTTVVCAEAIVAIVSQKRTANPVTHLRRRKPRSTICTRLPSELAASPDRARWYSKRAVFGPHPPRWARNSSAVPMLAGLVGTRRCAASAF